MIDKPQKQIQELISRYRLEPEIRDVFVEGRSDAVVIERFLRVHNFRDVAVYQISTVEIPARALLESGQPDGMRGRVVFLAFELAKILPVDSKAVTCIADRDYDTVLNREYKTPFLLFMDYSCMEMYAFHTDVLDNVVASIAPALGKNSETILAQLEPILRRLYLIRATNIALGLGLRWLDSFADSCTLKNDLIEFDEGDFITRYLSKNSQLKAKATFIRELAEIASRTNGDRRLFIRGHDFFSVLAWYLRQFASKTSPFFQSEVLGQFLLAMVDHSSLVNYKFFQLLASRIAPLRQEADSSPDHKES
jgi:hypothetical protein